METFDFDYIVVGGGTAGCVIADRLSEDPRMHVLLVEAGMDLPPGHEPPEILDPFPSAFADPRYIWAGLVASVGPDRGGERGRYKRPWIQGRLIGGGSSINGMLAQRGAPADFEEWVALGADGWGWDEVLPYYKRLEHDMDFQGPDHGQDGPIPIRRHRPEQWPGFARAFAEAWQVDGLPYLPDVHASHCDGVSPAAMNNLPDRRVGAAQAYLGASARARSNLKILSNGLVEQVLMRERRAVGVRVRTPTGTLDFSAGEIVLCGGGVLTPALLMRSGIGPARALQAAGVQPRVDLPGVGQGLQNHPAFHLATYLHRGGRQSGALRPPFHAFVRFSSQLADCPPTDMACFALPRAGWHPIGSRIGAISVFVHKPYSRGEVGITSPDAAVMPRVDFNLLSDPRDFERLLIGASRILRLLASPAMSPAIHEVFLPTGGHANAFNVRSAANWAKSWIAAGLFDLGPAVRRVLLGSSVIDPGALANDRAALENAIRETAACVHHPAGSCRIGRKADPFAVVDPELRVHGVQALRVADASIMPTIVTAGTHLTALMIGEKAADMIRRDWHGARSDVRCSTAEVVTRAPTATGRARSTSGTAGSEV